MDGLPRRGILSLSHMNGDAASLRLYFIVIFPCLFFVLLSVIWLHWPWHTDRSLRYTPIHV